MTACSGSLFQSKAAPPTIYVLSPGAVPADSGAAAAIPADLAVLKPRLRTGLESDRIAVLYPDRRLDYFADARWSGALGDVLQDFTVQEFRAHSHLRTVNGDAFGVRERLLAGNRGDGFSSRVRLRRGSAHGRTCTCWRVSAMPAIGAFSANSRPTARQPAAENRLSAIVDAYARAADTAFTAIAGRAEESLVKVSETR